MSLGGPERWDLVYLRWMGYRWKYKWFIYNNRRSHLCNDCADAGRRVNVVVGALEVAYTCPKVCSILQLEDTREHAYKVWLKNLGVWNQVEPGKLQSACVTLGAADNKL